MNINQLATNSLFLNKGSKIQDGCQSCLLIAATKIAHVILSIILKQLQLP